MELNEDSAENKKNSESHKDTDTAESHEDAEPASDLMPVGTASGEATSTAVEPVLEHQAETPEPLESEKHGEQPATAPPKPKVPKKPKATKPKPTPNPQSKKKAPKSRTLEAVVGEQATGKRSKM